MFSRDSKNDRLIKAAKHHGLELQPVSQPLFKTILDQLKNLPAYQALDSDALRNLILSHVFNHLDAYIKPIMNERWLKHPNLVAASRALMVTIVIIYEENREPPLVIKHQNSIKTVYLAYGLDKEYHPCFRNGQISRADLDDIIRSTLIDSANPALKPCDVNKALFNAASIAIEDTVQDASLMGWFQVLVGPKNSLPNKRHMRDVIKIKNEIYLTVTALHTAIKCVLPLIENDYKETIKAEIQEHKTLALADLKKRNNAEHRRLKRLQRDMKANLMKIEKKSELEISQFKKDFDKNNYNGRKLVFTTPAEISKEELAYLKKGLEFEDTCLEQMEKIRRETDELIRNTTLHVREIAKNIKILFSQNLGIIFSEVENINWDTVELNASFDYIKEVAKDYIEKIYQQPLPKSCNPLAKNSEHLNSSSSSIAVMQNLNRPDIIMYGNTQISYLTFIEQLLHKMVFVVKDSYEINLEMLKDKIVSGLHRQKETLFNINKNYIVNIIQDKISATVADKFITEREAEINQAFIEQESKIIKLIPVKESIKLIDVLTILNNHIVTFQAELTESEKAAVSEDQEEKNYLSQGTIMFNANISKLSPFINLFTAQEFCQHVINTQTHKKILDKFCDSANGDTLLHKANTHVSTAYRFDNVVLIIKFLIMQGANIMTRNNHGELACNLLSDQFDRRSRLPWTVARIQLELLTIYSSNLAEMITSALLGYLSSNEKSWSFWFHNRAVKKTRLELVLDLFEVLNLSRLGYNDDSLLDKLDDLRTILFKEHRSSKLKDALVVMFDNIEKRPVVFDVNQPQQDLSARYSSRNEIREEERLNSAEPHQELHEWDDMPSFADEDNDDPLSFMNRNRR